MDELLGAFVSECRESLAALEDELLRLERRPDDKGLLASVFRRVHTIKGTCGFLDLRRIERLAHAIEDVLGRLRNQELAPGAQVVTLLLEALDRLETILDGVARAELEPNGDDGPLIAALEGHSALGAPDGRGRWATTPARKVDAERAGARCARAATAGAAGRPPERLQQQRMMLTGELDATHDPLLSSAALSDDLAVRPCLGGLAQVTRDPRNGVRRARLQPIGAAWSHLPRLARELAAELDKPIALEMQGADIEIDSRLVQLIKVSLTHLVRNAADHGLEDRAERHRHGKPESGRIVVNAYRRAGHVLIEVGDDGQGLDIGRITSAAEANGLVGHADATPTTAAACQRLIFQPGLSTAESVTPVSGRGVGLDVVRTGIERMGGEIDVRFVPSRGSIFTLKIPQAQRIAPVDDEPLTSAGATSRDLELSSRRSERGAAKHADARRLGAWERAVAARDPDRQSAVPLPSG